MSLPTQKLGVKTDEQRERIVFGRTIAWGKDTSGQFARIGRLGEFGPDYITPKTFRRLIEDGYINLDSTQNASPTMGELCTLGENVQRDDSVGSVRYTGYMIGPERDDARITLTAVTIKPESGTTLSKDVQRDFENVCRTGDEYERDGYRCHAWWD
jgi:hypothetical protein